MKEEFSEFYGRNAWGCEETVSGAGSSLKSTEKFRGELSALISELGVKSILDCPCGDFNYMREVNLDGIRYVGGDIVDDLIMLNREKYSAPNVDFEVIDLSKDKLPKCDLIVVKDLFLHLYIEEVQLCIENIRKSGIKWALLDHDHFTIINKSPLTRNGDHRYNLTIEPFELHAPLKTLEIETIYEAEFNKIAKYMRCLWEMK